MPIAPLGVSRRPRPKLRKRPSQTERAAEPTTTSLAALRQPAPSGAHAVRQLLELDADEERIHARRPARLFLIRKRAVVVAKWFARVGLARSTRVRIHT